MPDETQATVISQRRTFAMLPDNTFGPVYQVTFRSAGGVVGSVDVPISDYTPAKVRELVTQHASDLDEVQGM